MAAPTTTKEALRQRARLLEAGIEERNAATEKANRDDEMELGRIYLDLAALMAHTHRTEPEPPKGEAASTDAGKADAQRAEQAKAKAAPDDEPVEVGDDLGKQEAVLGFLHKYEGQTFEVAYVGAAMYPGDEPTVAYKKLYATLDAMVANKKAVKVKGEKARWNPLKPRPARPIRFPSGLVLLANGDVQEAGQ